MIKAKICFVLVHKTGHCSRVKLCVECIFVQH